eukprot:1233127-Rhodomonas_salina.1
MAEADKDAVHGAGVICRAWCVVTLDERGHEDLNRPEARSAACRACASISLALNLLISLALNLLISPPHERLRLAACALGRTTPADRARTSTRTAARTTTPTGRARATPSTT